MKTIEVVIPTRNRHDKLSQVIDSIVKCEPINHDSIPVYIEIILIFDGDHAGWKKFRHSGNRCIYMVGHNGAVKCRNTWISTSKADFILYATDDIIFDEYSIETVFESMTRNFPDGDGVCGFHQEGNDKYHPTGVALVGKKFIDRYPGRQLFNPDYFHFACQEIHWLAKKLDKFFLCMGAVVKHLNPNIKKEYMDSTHHDARIHTKEDHALIAKRIADGLIWGE